MRPNYPPLVRGLAGATPLKSSAPRGPFINEHLVVLGRSGCSTSPPGGPVPPRSCRSGLLACHAALSTAALRRSCARGTFNRLAANEAMKNVVASCSQVAALALGGKLALDSIPVPGVDVRGSGLLVEVALI